MVDAPGQRLTIDGQVVSLTERFAQPKDLIEAIQSLYHFLPCVLTVTLWEPQSVKRVEGNVGGVPFEWILERWSIGFHSTTQDEQEDAAIRGWRLMTTVTQPKRERLLAALHYFRQACRLNAAAELPGEFLAEVLLNLAKVMDVLFPHEEGEGSIDAARKGLARLGYDTAQIEGDFVPALALRNEVDVAHALVGRIHHDDLRALHDYADGAEKAFRDLLDRVLDRVDSEPTLVKAYNPGPAPRRTKNAIVRLRRAREGRTNPGPSTSRVARP